MKKFFTILFFAIIIFIIALGFLLFAFEKDIPTKYIQSSIEKVVSNYSFEDFSQIDQAKDFDVSITKTNYSTTTEKETFISKTQQKFIKTGMGGTIKVTITEINYNEDGTISSSKKTIYYLEKGEYCKRVNDEINIIEKEKFEKEIYNYFKEITPTNSYGKFEDESAFKIITENAKSKGLNVTIKAIEDNEEMELKYNFITNKFVAFNKVTPIEIGLLKGKIIYNYEFNF